MKLSDLRRRIAKAIAPSEPEQPWETNPYTVRMPLSDGLAMGLEPMEDAPIPPMPGQAVPLTEAQRENLEKLRDRYAPDRQKPTSGLDRMRDADIKRYQAGER